MQRTHYKFEPLDRIGFYTEKFRGKRLIYKKVKFQVLEKTTDSDESSTESFVQKMRNLSLSVRLPSKAILLLGADAAKAPNSEHWQLGGPWQKVDLVSFMGSF